MQFIVTDMFAVCVYHEMLQCATACYRYFALCVSQDMTVCHVLLQMCSYVSITRCDSV